MQLSNFTTPWGVKLQAYVRENTNDTDTLISCLNEDEYNVARLPVGGVAIDLGGHIGGSALELLSRGYFVHIVEMFPENLEVLKKNIELNGYTKHVRIWEGAIASEKKEVSAYYANTATEAGQVHQFIGTLLRNKTPAGSLGGGREIKVPTFTLEEIMKEAKRCDFLKIDIEGAEWDAIKTPPEVLKKIKRIAVEIEGIDRVVSTNDFLKLLPGFKDVSKEYFPLWSHPSEIVHGYFINEIY